MCVLCACGPFNVSYGSLPLSSIFVHFIVFCSALMFEENLIKNFSMRKKKTHTLASKILINYLSKALLFFAEAVVVVHDVFIGGGDHVRKNARTS